MKNYREALINLLRDDSGQDLIEYALIAGVIGLGAVAALTPLNTAIAGLFTKIQTALAAA